MGSEFYRELLINFFDKGLDFFFFLAQLHICAAFSHYLRRLLGHTRLLLRVGVPPEIVLVVTSAKAQSWSDESSLCPHLPASAPLSPSA